MYTVPEFKNNSTRSKQKIKPPEASSSKQGSSGIKDIRQWLYVASSEEIT
jgi:hypothetical protein